MQPVIDAIIELAEKAGKEPFDFEPADHLGAARARSPTSSARDLAAAYKITKKDERYAAVGALRDKAKAASVKSDANPDGADANVFKEAFKAVESDIVRARIVKEKGRIDGRAVDKVRPIECMVGFLPRTHGSALFTRGETQSIVVATLGTGEDEQFIDALSRHDQRALHAPLQLPSLQRRRNRPHGRGRPPRNRPRQVGVARDEGGAADGGAIPVHGAPGFRDHRVRTARPRWPRCAVRRWR